MDATPKGRKKSRATMMDVAELAGVSQATVSLVLNGSPDVKLAETTRERVRTAARDLGYSLPRRKSRKLPDTQPVLLFLADEISSDPWMTAAFDGAQKKALEFGLNAVLAVAADAENEAVVMEQFQSTPLAGIIYGTILTRQVRPSAQVMRHPTVLLNGWDKDRSLHSVVPGDALGGRTAVEHLLDRGRTRIALINGLEGLEATQDRARGYRQALASRDIPFDPVLVRDGNWEARSGYEETKALLALESRPDAIFCANDPMAFGCYEAIREAGLKIPDDISVIGFDDREIAKDMHPPLTTMVLPHYEMGEIAAEILIEMAGGHNTLPIQVKVDCPLVVRASV